MKYEVLTSYGVYDINEENHEEEQENLVAEQDFLLVDLGYEWHKEYVVKFDNKEIVIMSPYDSIQSLALKEGADLVRYENDNIGFVGYYGNRSIENNCFEILRLPTNEDIEKWENGETITE